MLIKLIPRGIDQPTVLFTLTFPSLPPQLPFPPKWSLELQNLTADDLDLPAIHALDYSARWSSLVQDVVFNVPQQTIQVSYIDGDSHEWPIMGSLSMFDQIVKDVSDSAIQSEIEAEAEKEEERANMPLPVAPPPPPPVLAVKPTKHKKQRSLFMSLVTSLVPSSSSSGFLSSVSPLPSVPASLPPSPVKPKRTITRGPYEPELSARALRRRARSTLVDSFRMFVVTELSSRAIPGGYYAWAAQSMLKRATEHMSFLMREASILDQARIEHEEQGGLPGRHMMFSPTPVEDLSFSHFPTSSSQEDVSTDAQSFCTDTDGSSLHTPTSSHWNSYSSGSSPFFAPAHQKESSRSKRAHPHMSLEDHRLYTTLHQHTLRLRHLISISASNATHLADEEAHRLQVLEIRSRRRAWLNKAFIGGTATCGMAAPFEASGLGRWSWGPNEFFAEDEEGDDTLVGTVDAKGGYQLWPVSEGEESDDDIEDREDDARLLRDLEFDSEDVLLVPSAPMMRPRARTFTLEVRNVSSEKDDEDMTPPLKPRPRARTLAVSMDVATMVSQTLHNMSLLSQPLTTLPGHVKEELHGVGLDGEPADFIGADPFADSGTEFTLAMDAPTFAKGIRAF